MATLTPSAVQSASPQLAKRRGRGSLWLKRLGLGLLGLILVLAVAGFIYQLAATASNRRSFAPLGQVVDIGGRSLHLN